MIRRSKPKIGLALGSGSARGLAHIGVLKALKEKNISIDVIAGSSMGAFVGACYARNEDITNLEEVVLNLDWKQFAQLADPNLALLFKGIFSGKKVKELLRTIIGDVKFKDLKIPLAVVTTDVNTGEEIVIKEGSVIEAIPSIFDVVIQAIYAMEYEITTVQISRKPTLAEYPAVYPIFDEMVH